MMNYKEILGLFSVLICFYSYFIYFRSIFKKEIKPHLFSWFIWTITSSIAYAGQMSDNAGSGAWVTGFVTICCLSVTLLSIKFGEKNITAFDWVCLLLSLSAIPLWIFTKSALGSIILVTLIDVVGYFPSYRKSWLKPKEENATSFFLSGVQYIFSFMALFSYTWITAFTPVVLIFVNIGFALMLAIRRKILK